MGYQLFFSRSAHYHLLLPVTQKRFFPTKKEKRMISELKVLLLMKEWLAASLVACKCCNPITYFLILLMWPLEPIAIGSWKPPKIYDFAGFLIV